jgi:hypothetical protein
MSMTFTPVHFDLHAYLYIRCYFSLVIASMQSIGRELIRQRSARFFAAPEVILRMRKHCLDKANGLEVFDHHISSRPYLSRIGSAWLPGSSRHGIFWL